MICESKDYSWLSILHGEEEARKDSIWVMTHWPNEKLRPSLLSKDILSRISSSARMCWSPLVTDHLVKRKKGSYWFNRIYSCTGRNNFRRERGSTEDMSAIILNLFFFFAAFQVIKLYSAACQETFGVASSQYNFIHHISSRNRGEKFIFFHLRNMIYRVAYVKLYTESCKKNRSVEKIKRPRPLGHPAWSTHMQTHTKAQGNTQK